MSIHSSLALAGKLKRHRNVLTRAERLELLRKEQRWTEGQSIFGLPKVRCIMAKAKKKKEEAAEGAAAPVAAAATAAAPAKDKAPAKEKAPAKKDEKKK